MRRVAAVLLAVALVCPFVSAEPRYVSVSATQTSGTTVLAVTARHVTIVNDGANTVYVRLFANTEVPAASTTSYLPLKLNESVTFDFDALDSDAAPGNAPAAGYGSLSAICATGETATLRVYYK